jgi:hypothetical protein
VESGGVKTNLLEAAGSAADRVRVHLMGDTCEVLRGLLLEELKPGRGHGRGCGRERMPESAFLRSARRALPASRDAGRQRDARRAGWSPSKFGNTQLWVAAALHRHVHGLQSRRRTFSNVYLCIYFFLSSVTGVPGLYRIRTDAKYAVLVLVRSWNRQIPGSP